MAFKTYGELQRASMAEYRTGAPGCPDTTAFIRSSPPATFPILCAQVFGSGVTSTGSMNQGLVGSTTDADRRNFELRIDIPEGTIQRRNQPAPFRRAMRLLEDLAPKLLGPLQVGFGSSLVDLRTEGALQHHSRKDDHGHVGAIIGTTF